MTTPMTARKETTTEAAVDDDSPDMSVKLSDISGKKYSLVTTRLKSIVSACACARSL
jgi:hypothetical protein